MRLVAIAVAAIALIPCTGMSDSLRCGANLVSAGDLKAEVSSKCGEPYWKEHRDESTVEEVDVDTRRRTTLSIDEWTYNFGPNAFVAFLRFENGVLVSIRTGGYGSSLDGSMRGCRDGLDISVGMMSAEVAMKCGYPATRDSRDDEVVEKYRQGKVRKIVSVEEWTYLRQNGTPLVLKFENGRLISVNAR